MQAKSQAIWSEFRGIVQSNAARSKPQPSKYNKQLPQFKTNWVSERVELLKKLHADGLSMEQIAVRIGEVTRNAVIGKLHRLGLAAGTTPRIRPARPRAVPPKTGITPLLKAQKPPKAALIRVRVPNRITTPVLDETAPGNLKLTDLTETMCHWPVGDPREQGFHFCARRKSFGAPYCEHHAAIAYNPAARRARRAA